MGRGLVDLLFPPGGCLLCGNREKEGVVCRDCLSFLETARTLPFCPVCGRFGEGEICLDCRIYSRPFTLCRAAGPYEGALKQAIRRLKYERKREGVEYLGGLLAEVVTREPAYQRARVVVPVPTSPERRRQRGFDQAELLARELAWRLGLPLCRWLKKEIPTPPQTGLGRGERLLNLRGSFGVCQNPKLGGAVVLLVDDVFTTGSTLTAAAEALLAGGAAEVLGLVLAAARIFT
ncbi:ComF family protein [Ammonifex thiophilus]|uniref:ComF family protein n=1 Tax=Ammonifex thiophilus TaxID=444093 RepID=UPI001402231B|nr:ComF family protein [Ammonifex thiophilus]